MPDKNTPRDYSWRGIFRVPIGLAFCCIKWFYHFEGYCGQIYTIGCLYRCNHMRGMQYQILLNLTFCPETQICMHTIQYSRMTRVGCDVRPSWRRDSSRDIRRLRFSSLSAATPHGTDFEDDCNV